MGRTSRMMSVAPGFYARKQVLSKSWIIRWSHRSRFQLARQLVGRYSGKLLDYGCGDGAFIADVRDLFFNLIGADLDPGAIGDCRERFGSIPNVSFVLTSELSGSSHSGVYDVVTCMEVLEHCVESARVNVLSDLARLVASPGGVVIVSVPIEIGPTVLGKQMVRAIAGWRSLGDYAYRERYTVGELITLLFAGNVTSFERPIYSDGCHGHKGFNWRQLRRELCEQFEILETRYSPIGVLGGILNSQVWFVCRPKSVNEARVAASVR